MVRNFNFRLPIHLRLLSFPGVKPGSIRLCLFQSNYLQGVLLVIIYIFKTCLFYFILYESTYSFFRLSVLNFLHILSCHFFSIFFFLSFWAFDFWMTLNLVLIPRFFFVDFSLLTFLLLLSQREYHYNMKATAFFFFF